MSILEYIASFSLFVVLQSFAINGWHQSFQDGMIFNKIKLFFKDRIPEKIQLPIWGCIRCESSLIGGIIYWTFVLLIFGFHKIEIPIYILDVFILVHLNFFIYKRQ